MAIGLSIYHHAPSQILIFQCLIIFGYPAVSHVETNPNTACFVIFDPAIPPIWDWFYSHSLRQTPIFNWFKGPLTFKDPSLKESSESNPRASMSLVARGDQRAPQGRRALKQLHLLWWRGPRGPRGDWNRFENIWDDFSIGALLRMLYPVISNMTRWGR